MKYNMNDVLPVCSQLRGRSPDPEERTPSCYRSVEEDPRPREPGTRDKLQSGQSDIGAIRGGNNCGNIVLAIDY